MTNRFLGVNFIHDNVRMAVPPEFFLQRLYDFDADLVMLPSRQVPFAYVLGRRRRLTAGLTDKAIVDTCQQKDTVMCMAHGLVPVTLIYQIGTTWNIDPILKSLKARDIWAHGGAEKFANALDEREEAERKKLRANIRDDMWQRSGDAWRSYQARTGQRTKPTLVGNTRSRSATGTADSNSASGSTAGSGRIITTFV